MGGPAGINDFRSQLLAMLQAIPSLPAPAAHAIAREVESRVAQWTRVTKDLAAGASGMPDIVAAATDEFEWDAVMALVCKFGGQRVYIPKDLPAGHHLVVEFGPEIAGVLVRKFGGEPMAVPRASELLRVARNKAIIADFQAGKTPNQLARDPNLAYPWVLALLARHRRERTCACSRVSPSGIDDTGETSTAGQRCRHA